MFIPVFCSLSPILLLFFFFFFFFFFFSLSLSLSLSLSTAGYYIKVMKKVMEKGVEYIKNESERLGRILSELKQTRCNPSIVQLGSMALLLLMA